MPRFRTVVLIALGSVLLVGASIWIIFDRDMRAARAVLDGRSAIADTAMGVIEYAVLGEGAPLLTIHGAGGGFDQGLTNATEMIGQDFHLISPSRFGYLHTPVPADPSPSVQADAHKALLDTLGIQKVVVLGVSAGTRSALELALRHRERVEALILVVPATYVPDMVALESRRAADFPMVLWLVNHGADFAWWVLEHVSPDTLVRFVGVPPAALHAASSADQAAAMAVVRSIAPLSERFAGISVDSQPDLAPRPLESLAVPTLIITARDDLFDTLPSAEYAASQIPNSRLVVFEQGGHLLVGHRAEVREAIREFLASLDASSDGSPR